MCVCGGGVRNEGGKINKMGKVMRKEKKGEEGRNWG